MLVNVVRYLVVGEMEGAVMVAVLIGRMMAQRYGWQEGNVAASRWVWYGVWGLAALGVLNGAPLVVLVALLLLLLMPAYQTWWRKSVGEGE